MIPLVWAQKSIATGVHGRAGCCALHFPGASASTVPPISRLWTACFGLSRCDAESTGLWKRAWWIRALRCCCRCCMGGICICANRYPKATALLWLAVLPLMSISGTDQIPTTRLWCILLGSRWCCWQNGCP